MTIPESEEHSKIKQIMANKLKEWFGVSIQEYPSTGHELDVFSASIEGICIYCEVIWSNSRTHFLSDINMLQQSDADVKFVIASPSVIANKNYQREFSKVVVSQRRKGHFIHGEMIDGQKILNDTNFVENELKPILLKMVESKISSRRQRLVEKSSIVTELTPQEYYPDEIKEELLSNLFPVMNYPKIVYNAPTMFDSPNAVILEIGDEPSIPPFILRNGRIYSFSDMSSKESPFNVLIKGGVFSENIENWKKTISKWNWFIELLNHAIRKYCELEGLEYYKKKKRLFFPPKDDSENTIEWKPGYRKVKRTVAKPIMRADGTVNFWFHYAVGLNFITIADRIYLKIEPSIVFTNDGYEPITAKRIGPLTTRWQRNEYNAAYLGHIRFWASFLAKNNNKIVIPTGGPDIEISINTALVNLDRGIQDDVRNIEQMFELIEDEKDKDFDSFREEVK
jgi:hypothetical protein